MLLIKGMKNKIHIPFITELISGNCNNLFVFVGTILRKSVFRTGITILFFFIEELTPNLFLC